MKFLCLLVVVAIVLVHASPRNDIMNTASTNNKPDFTRDDVMKAHAEGTKLNRTLTTRTSAKFNGSGGGMTAMLQGAGWPTTNELTYPYDCTAPKDWNDIYVANGNPVNIEPATGCVCSAGLSCVKTTCSGCFTLNYCYNPTNGQLTNPYYLGIAEKWLVNGGPDKYIYIDWYPLPSGTPFSWESQYDSSCMT